MTKKQLPKKDTSLCVRVPGELLNQLKEMEHQTGVSPACLIRHILKDVYHYCQEHGELRLPFQVIPSKELAKLREKAAAKQVS